MSTANIKLQPLPVPHHVTIDLPASKKDKGIFVIPIDTIDDEALEQLAHEWLDALFANRGKRNPFSLPPKSAPEKSA